jgi:hypothetical protein
VSKRYRSGCGRATLAANRLASANGLPALDGTHAWNASSKTVVTVADTTPNWIQSYQFIMLFTPAEHSAIVASTDPKVQQFLMAVTSAQKINLKNPVVQNGVDYLASIGQANATLILSGQPSQ